MPTKQEILDEMARRKTGSTPDTEKAVSVAPGLTKSQIQAEMTKRGKYDTSTWSGALSDYLDSLRTGITKGAAALPGLPGSASELMESAVGSVGLDKSGALGHALLNVAVPGYELLKHAPNSSETVKAYTDWLNQVPASRVHEPQTTLGRYIEAGGEGLTGAVLSGGASGLAVLSGLVAGLGSEGAGDLVKALPEQFQGGKFEAAMRLGGGLIGAIAGRGRGASAPKIAADIGRKEGSTMENISRQVDEAYGNLDMPNVGIAAPEVRQASKDLREAFREGGLTPSSAPGATANAAEFHALPGPVPMPTRTSVTRPGIGNPRSPNYVQPREDVTIVPARPDVPVSMSDINSARKAAGRVANEYSPSRLGSDR